MREYVIQGYCRLYTAAINENGEYGDFLKFYNNADTWVDGKCVIPYNDYYCSERVYKEIVDDLCNEPYILINRKAIYNLTEYEKSQVKISIALGCSPSSSKEPFLARHPKFIKYYSLVD